MTELIGGRFRVGRPIGSGAQGRVVAAHDELLDRPVALKVLRAGGPDGNARARFLREARAAAGITHPNVVTVFDVGAVDGDLADPLSTPYIAMELVAGPSLSQVLADHGQLSVVDAVEVARQILAGLGAAHAGGLIHRDVKPGNALLSPDGTVKLTDFGVATSTDGGADLTQTGAVLGTVAYLAPERILGRPATAASDLYAVGAILHELLTGRPPFTADTALAVAMAHGNSPVPDARASRPDVPPALASVVTRALAKDPAQRFRSAADMDAALAATMDPAARPAGLPPDRVPAELHRTASLPPPAGLPAAAAPATASPGAAPPGAAPSGAASSAAMPRTATSRAMSPAGGAHAGQATERGPLDGVGSDPAGRRPGRGAGVVLTAMLGVGGLLVAVVVAVLVGSSLDTGGPTSGGSATAVSPTTAAPSPSTPPIPAPAPPSPPSLPTPPPPAPPTPGSADLDELITRLSDDPDSFGDRGEDLLERLERVRDADPEDRGRLAIEAATRAARWTRQGDLDPGIATDARSALVDAVGRDLLDRVGEDGDGDGDG